MFKISYFFYKHPYLSYFILLIIFCLEGYIANYVIPMNNTTYIIILIITFFIYYYFLVNDCIVRPLIDFIKDCNVSLYKSRVSMVFPVKNVANKKDYDFNKFLCDYYENGPSKALIQMGEKAKKNNKPYQNQWYSKLLFYMYIEFGDYENAKKTLKEINNLVIHKNNKINNFLEYLESILKYTQDNDANCKNNIFNHIKTSKKRPDVTYDYYILAINCMKKKDTEKERKYLEKVIELGNDTFMARKAKKRLEIIKN